MGDLLRHGIFTEAQNRKGQIIWAISEDNIHTGTEFHHCDPIARVMETKAKFMIQTTQTINHFYRITP